MDNTKYWQENDEYHERQGEVGSIESNVALFTDILPFVEDAKTVIELGAGTGRNLKALKKLRPSLRTTGIEINESAAEQIHADLVIVADIFDINPYVTADLVFTKGVLIHIHPDQIQEAYDKIYLASRKYILLCEYYNPTLMGISYQGRADLLWKRDFAGEMMDMYKDLRLVSYGFHYHRDPYPQDDITWFLLEKK